VTDGRFYWLNETDAATYTNWDEHEPDNGWNNEHCAFLNTNGMWGDSCCNNEHWPEINHFICQKPAK
jgi:hypothetical protein